MSTYSNQSTGQIRDETSMWAGWTMFAGIVMIMIGALNAIQGVVALFNRDFYLSGPQNVLVFDLTAWGWVHLVLGVLVAITGIALLADAGWARPVTVVLAALNAVAELAFLGAYPLWSTIAIALCVMVIWSIVAHGDESRLDW